MVFSSIPVYLDPVNWQQQQQPPPSQPQPQQQQILLQRNGTDNSCNNPSAASNHHHHHHHHHHQHATVLSNPQPPTNPSHVGGGSSGPIGPTGSSSIRPGSMAERARMANIPMPEPALKCPRCESTNTKFCYFNNYSLSQPRHFCKTCRRYWTRGGALRSVPVGGGCRRNKRSKGSKSSAASCSSNDISTTTATTAATAAAATSTTSSATSGAQSLMNNNVSLMADILGLTSQVSPLRLMPPLTSLNRHDYGEDIVGGLNYVSSMSATAVSDISYHLGNNFSLGGGCYAGGSGGPSVGGRGFLLSSTPPALQFPLLGGIDSTPLYPFEPSIEMSGGGFGHIRPKMMHSGMVMHGAAGDVKMEDNQELSLSRHFLALQGNEHYWGGVGGNGGGGGGGGSWTDMSGVNSSCSDSHAL